MAQDRLFAFSIPVIPRHKAKSWQRVIDNLQATLQSMLNQFDRNFLVLVASGDEIDLPEMSNSRVQRVALPANYAPHLKGDSHRDHLSDAGIKRWYNLNAALGLNVTYFMHADADDLVSNRLVEYARAENHPIGYAVSHGFVMDYLTGKILPFPSEKAPGRTFDTACGTSIIYNLGFKGSQDPNWPNGLITAGHHITRQTMIAVGTPLKDVPFPAVVYVLNSSDNMSSLPDAAPSGTNYMASIVHKASLLGAPMLRSQMHEFGLSTNI